jgi:protein TonB
MEIKKILDADYLDIVYENRNKKYGSYELRSNYDKRLKKAIGFMLLGIGVIGSCSFISSRNAVDVTPYHRVDTVTVIDIKPKKADPVILPSRHITPPPPPAKTVAYMAPRVQPDDMVTPDKVLIENPKLDRVQIGPSNADGDTATIDPGIAGKGTGKGLFADTRSSPDVPFKYVEQMPQFNGDLHAYISRHIHYPEQASHEGVQGKVVVRFVVNEDGSVSEATILSSVGYGCDEEALHVIQGMPKWKPGKQNGKTVRVYFNLPISFELN